MSSDEAVNDELGPTLSSDHGRGEKPPAPPWPAQIGRFRIERQLGEGGMGVVLLGTDATLGRHVALKLLRAGGNADADGRKRFLREAQVMARLAHDNVVIVHEVGEHDGHAFVAME